MKFTPKGKPLENPVSWYCAQGIHFKCIGFRKPASRFVACHCACHRTGGPRVR